MPKFEHFKLLEMDKRPVLMMMTLFWILVIYAICQTSQTRESWQLMASLNQIYMHLTESKLFTPISRMYSEHIPPASHSPQPLLCLFLSPSLFHTHKHTHTHPSLLLFLISLSLFPAKKINTRGIRWWSLKSLTMVKYGQWKIPF